MSKQFKASGTQRQKALKSSSENQNRKHSRTVLYESMDPTMQESFEDPFTPAYDEILPSSEFEDKAYAWYREEFAENSMNPPEECVLGCVVRLDRGYPLVVTKLQTVRAEHAIALVKNADKRAAVGDWVLVSIPQTHDKARIEAILPRKSELTRWDGSNRGQRQVLAANLDLLIAVQALSKRPVSCERIMRSLVIAYEGNMQAAVVLTKADRSANVEADVKLVRAAIGPNIPLVVTSSLDNTGIEQVKALVPFQTSALLLGESGAGKSTLVNTMVGSPVLGTSAVREKDDLGRHTTVARRMLKLPDAGVLADAPGLRSLPLLNEDRGLACVFPEIDERIHACRFRDCSHGSEPGCAVREGVASGEVDPDRLERYRAFTAEMLHNRRSLDLSAPLSLTK